MAELTEFLVERHTYVLVLALLAVGLFGILAASNLVKKLIGLVIFSTAIFLFFIQGSVVDGGAVPIIDPELGSDPTAYVDPLPHLLILTAIVVGVGVLGVGLALLVVLHRRYGTLEEADLIAQLEGRAAPAGRDGRVVADDPDGDVASVADADPEEDG